MRLGRAQGIIIRDNKALFGYGNIGSRNGHFFIGGGIETGETASEAVLREISEEANVRGKIIFQLKEGVLENHTTFLVDIGQQQCTLGYDPEEVESDKDKLALQKLIWIPLSDKEEFTSIDIDYFKNLIEECKERGIYPEWFEAISELAGGRTIK